MRKYKDSGAQLSLSSVIELDSSSSVEGPHDLFIFRALNILNPFCLNLCFLRLLNG